MSKYHIVGNHMSQFISTIKYELNVLTDFKLANRTTGYFTSKIMPLNTSTLSTVIKQENHNLSYLNLSSNFQTISYKEAAHEISVLSVYVNSFTGVHTGKFV